jgi:ribonuclease E
VVTRTRRRSASRPAGPPALPATSTTGGAGTLPESGLVEPGTAGVELGASSTAGAPTAEGHAEANADAHLDAHLDAHADTHVVEHVPIKKKGSRKR